MSNDKAEATGYEGPLPQRTPLETFAQHGAPPVAPHPHAEVPPGVPPWGSLYQDIGHPAPKKRRTWLWVVAIVAGVFVLCSVGGVLLLGAGGNAVVNTVHQEATARAAEVTVTGCSVGQFDYVTVEFTIRNTSDRSQSYLPGFNIKDTKGTVYSQAYGSVNDLAPGQTYKGSAVAIDAVPAKTKIVCSQINP